MSERIIGVRAGLAGAGEPAWLTEPMVLPPGAGRGSGSVRAAPEIAFVMSARLAMGHPAQALAQAANQLGGRGLAIEPGGSSNPRACRRCKRR